MAILEQVKATKDEVTEDAQQQSASAMLNDTRTDAAANRVETAKTVKLQLPELTITGKPESYDTQVNTAPIASMDQFVQVGKEVLLRMAPDGTAVNKAELANAVEDPSYSGQQAQALAALYADFGKLESTTDGLRAADLDKAVASSPSVWDADGGLIPTMILRTARAESGAMSRSLYATSAALDSIKAGAVNQGNEGDCYFLAALAATAKFDPQAIENAIKDNQDGTYTVTFPGARNTPVTIKGPTQTELGEFNGGTKYGIWASVMEKAYAQLMVDHPESVLALSASQSLLAAAISKDQGLEENTKAQIAKSDAKDMLDERVQPLAEMFGILPAYYSGDLAQDYIGNGGSIADSLRLLAGKNVAAVGVYISDPNASSPRLSALSDKGINTSVLSKLLETAFASNPPEEVTAATASPSGNPQIRSNHAYTVTAFQPDGNGGGTVTLRNPWGKDYVPNGYNQEPQVTISLSAFMSAFTNLAVTQSGSTFVPGSAIQLWPYGDA